MIENRKQYDITDARLRLFKEDLARIKTMAPSQMKPLFIDSMESIIAELTEEMADYVLKKHEASLQRRAQAREH